MGSPMQPFYFIPAILLALSAIAAAVCLMYRRLEPWSFSGHVAKADRLIAAGRGGEALEVLDHALSSLTLETPEECELHFMLGSALLNEGKAAEAAGHYDHAINLALGSVEFDYSHEFTRVYEAYLKAGQREKAEKLCRYLLLTNVNRPCAEQIRLDARACGLDTGEEAPKTE